MCLKISNLCSLLIAANYSRRARHFGLKDRSSQAALREAATEWACLGGDGPAGYDWTSGGGFPHSNCPNGFRVRECTFIVTKAGFYYSFTARPAHARLLGRRQPRFCQSHVSHQSS